MSGPFQGAITGNFQTAPSEPPREFIIFNTKHMNETCKETCEIIRDFIAGCYYKSSGGSNMGQNGTQNFGGIYANTFFPMFGMANTGHIIKMSDFIKDTNLLMIKLFAQYCNDAIGLNFNQKNAQFATTLQSDFVTYYHMKDMFSQLQTILISYYFNDCQVIISIILAEISKQGFWVNNEGGRNFARFMKQSPIYSQLLIFITDQLRYELRIPTLLIDIREIVHLLINHNSQYTNNYIDDHTTIPKIIISGDREDSDIVQNFNFLIPGMAPILRRFLVIAKYKPDYIPILSQIIPYEELKKQMAMPDDDSFLLELLEHMTLDKMREYLLMDEDSFSRLLNNSTIPTLQSLGKHFDQQRSSSITQMGRGIRHQKSKRRKSKRRKLTPKKQKTKNKKTKNY